MIKKAADVRFHERLKKLIDSKEITIQELSEKSKINRVSIYGYLEGASPNLHKLDQIAKALECDPVELIKPEGPEFQWPPDIQTKTETLSQEDKNWLFDLIRRAILLNDESKHSILYQVRVLTGDIATTRDQKKKAIK